MLHLAPLGFQIINLFALSVFKTMTLLVQLWGLFQWCWQAVHAQAVLHPGVI